MSSSSPNRSGSPSASTVSRERAVAGSAAPYQPLPAAEIEKLLKLRTAAQGPDEELGPGDVQYLRGGTVRQINNPPASVESMTAPAENGPRPIIEPQQGIDSSALLNPQTRVNVTDFDQKRMDSLSPGPVSGQGLSLDDLGDLELDISIELGRAELLIEDVLKLREGSVVSLDKLAGDPVDIVANGRLVARGELLVVDGKFGVRLSEVL